MSSIFFITDFPHGTGGAELNDRCLARELHQKDNMVEFVKCLDITVPFVQDEDKNFIVSNFTYLHEYVREQMAEGSNYIIYEHDHKYCRTRNPGDYKDYKVPKADLVNQEFYKNAKAIFCQSKLHKEIVQKNLPFLSESQVVNVSGNFWSDQHLDIMKEKLKNGSKLLNTCSVMRSGIAHKGTNAAKKYCEENGLDYELISHRDYEFFLDMLGSYEYFAFFPRTIETLSRVIVEAKMMGVKIISYSIDSNRIGALSEEWILDDPREVIQYMRENKDRVTDLVLEKLCI